ncbi:hypothetical protein GDO78_015443 [Eleutherodactylus coqui]|uniref:Uncharacterized protein n=1 Tax=Eleutherodactylus coqui TaxID=57060 RepID=A0A8J6BE51_ELECQ|nr:hypothetical protein GDO78_015443 [Eleutherodactylus coqui]
MIEGMYTHIYTDCRAGPVYWGWVCIYGGLCTAGDGGVYIYIDCRLGPVYWGGVYVYIYINYRGGPWSRLSVLPAVPPLLPQGAPLLFLC